MAKWGEGDPRWIVEQRPDSINVNNWHWTERDATNWSKTTLKESMKAISNESEEGNWKIEDVKKIDGEATINNRKGKLIFFYEWVLQLEYKGKLSGSDLTHSGTIEIPNLSDENEVDEVDVIVHGKGDSKNSEKLKNIVRKDGIALVRKAVAAYISDLKAEYTKGMILPAKEKTSNNVLPKNAAPKKINEALKDLNVEQKKPKKNVVHVSLNLKEEFRTNAEELYKSLIDRERISAYTGGGCESDSVVGGKFSIMNGNISGTYTELVENKRIVQQWRLKEWAEGVNSKVTIELEQKDDCTLLKLTQIGVPDYDTVRTEEGWKRHLWGPMKLVFGFGAQLF